MLCTQCGAQSSDGATYCGQCGAAMAPPGDSGEASATHCTQCGAQTPIGAAYCGQCGAAMAPPGSGGEAATACCRTCGAPSRDGVAYCGECGAALALSRPIAEALPTVPPPVDPNAAGRPGHANVRRRRGCLRTGCLVAGIPVLLILLFVGWVVAVQTHTLEKIGLRTPPEQRLLGGRPNTAAAEALKAELLSAGFSDTGLEVAVLPVTGKAYNLAVVVMDASQGFQRSGTGDLILDCLQRLATGDAAAQYAIGRVAAHFYDATGRKTLSLTAATPDIEAFAAGRMSRTDFLRAVEGDVDWQTLMGGLP
jgi:Double zinc ribbon